ncbi:MAG: hypothetical protein IPP94_06085 [Ignavibacteria bacterium]|nr:hypothetical protein [Ignavibacteria bacterium]
MEHNDLIRPADGFKAIADVAFFGTGDDDDGNRWMHRYPFFPENSKRQATKTRLALKTVEAPGCDDALNLIVFSSFPYSQSMRPGRRVASSHDAHFPLALV